MIGEPTLITGATGAVGTSAVGALIECSPKTEILGLSRSRDTRNTIIPMRQGDYNDLASLQGAFRGVATLIFISSDGDRDTMLLHHRNVVQAARTCGVKRVLYSSILDVAESSPFYFSTVHTQTERLIAAESWQTCILRTSIFSEFLLSLIAKESETGRISVPAGGGAISLVSRHDVGEALARIASCAALFGGVKYVTGPNALRMGDVAHLISQVSGRDVKYLPLDVTAYAAQLRSRGLSGWLIEAIVSMFQSVALGNFSRVEEGLRDWLGHEPAPFMGALAYIRKAGRP